MTARVFGVLVPDVFPAVTATSPFCPTDPVVTVIDIEPCPPVIVHPVGTIHVYVVALVSLNAVDIPSKALTPEHD